MIRASVDRWEEGGCSGIWRMKVYLILTGDKLLAGKRILLSKSGSSFTTKARKVESVRFAAVTGFWGLIKDEWLLNSERIQVKSNPERLKKLSSLDMNNQLSNQIDFYFEILLFGSISLEWRSALNSRFWQTIWCLVVGSNSLSTVQVASCELRLMFSRDVRNTFLNPAEILFPDGQSLTQIVVKRWS